MSDTTTILSGHDSSAATSSSTVGHRKASQSVSKKGRKAATSESSLSSTIEEVAKKFALPFDAILEEHLRAAMRRATGEPRRSNRGKNRHASSSKKETRPKKRELSPDYEENTDSSDGSNGYRRPSVEDAPESNVGTKSSTAEIGDETPKPRNAVRSSHRRPAHVDAAATSQNTAGVENAFRRRSSHNYLSPRTADELYRGAEGVPLGARRSRPANEFSKSGRARVAGDAADDNQDRFDDSPPSPLVGNLYPRHYAQGPPRRRVRRGGDLARAEFDHAAHPCSSKGSDRAPAARDFSDQHSVPRTASPLFPKHGHRKVRQETPPAHQPVRGHIPKTFSLETLNTTQSSSQGRRHMESHPAFDGTPDSMGRMPPRKDYDPSWKTPTPQQASGYGRRPSPMTTTAVEDDVAANLKGATTEELFGPTVPPFDFDLFDASSVAAGEFGRDPGASVQFGTGGKENYKRDRGEEKVQASTACSEFARAGPGGPADGGFAFGTASTWYVPGQDIWGGSKPKHKNKSRSENGGRSHQRAYSIEVEECTSSVQGLHVGASQCVVISPSQSSTVIRQGQHRVSLDWRRFGRYSADSSVLPDLKLDDAPGGCYYARDASTTRLHLGVQRLQRRVVEIGMLFFSVCSLATSSSFPDVEPNHLPCSVDSLGQRPPEHSPPATCKKIIPAFSHHPRSSAFRGSHCFKETDTKPASHHLSRFATL